MKKLGIVFDSSSGLTQITAKKMDLLFIPLIIRLNGTEYKAGIDIDSKKLEGLMIKDKAKIQTSTPITADIIDVFDKAITRYEKVIYLGMSSKFSSTINNARLIVEQNERFKNKIFVYDSLLSSPWIELYFDEIISVVNKAKDIKEIESFLDFITQYATGWLAPGDIYWFYNGGRISKSQYLIGSIARIIPILKIQDGEIKKDVIKGLSLKSSMNKLVKELVKITNDLANNDIEYELALLKSGEGVKMRQLKSLILEKYENIKDEKILEIILSSEQTAHMGPEAFGVSYKIKNAEKLWKKSVL